MESLEFFLVTEADESRVRKLLKERGYVHRRKTINGNIVQNDSFIELICRYMNKSAKENYIKFRGNVSKPQIEVASLLNISLEDKDWKVLVAKNKIKRKPNSKKVEWQVREDFCFIYNCLSSEGIRTDMYTNLKIKG